MKKFLLFSGSGNQLLSQKIAKLLHVNLGKIEIVTFSDSEKRVRIEEKISNKIVYVIASLGNPVDVHLIELCLIGDALKNNDCHRMIAVIPYYGYARQDKPHREGEGVSARVMARLIEAVGFNKIVTVDLHSDLVSGYFHHQVTHLFGAEIFVEELRKYQERSRVKPGMTNELGMTIDDLVVVAPDAGAAKRAQQFAAFFNAPLCFIEKRRNLHKLHTLDRLKLVGDVKGKVAVLLDDVVTSGGTLVRAAEELKRNGAKKVFACVTHADFIKNTRQTLENSMLDEIYVSDSIKIKPEDKFDKLHVVSLAALLAEKIE